MALSNLKPLQGLIFRVVTIHGDRNEMVLRCVSEGSRYAGRQITIMGTRSLSQGEYLWMSNNTQTDEVELQRCLNAS